MKKQLLLAAFAATIIAGCTKTTTTPEPDKPVCEKGTLQFVNNSDNAYNVYVNGNLTIKQSGKTTRENDFPKGNYVIKVEQTEGYLLYPTIKEYKGTLDGCGKLVISYP